MPVEVDLRGLIERFERETGSEWRRRYKCVVEDDTALFTGSMQFVVRNVGADQFQVRYEHAPHEMATEVGGRDRIISLLKKLVKRRHLEKIEI